MVRPESWTVPGQQREPGAGGPRVPPGARGQVPRAAGCPHHTPSASSPLLVVLQEPVALAQGSREDRGDLPFGIRILRLVQEPGPAARPLLLAVQGPLQLGRLLVAQRLLQLPLQLLELLHTGGGW